MPKPITLLTNDYEIDIAPEAQTITFYSRRIHLNQIVRGGRIWTLRRDRYPKETWDTMIGWMIQWKTTT